MTFIEVADRVVELLRTRGRITYRALKREFNVDDDFIEDLKEELIDGQEVAVDKDGKVLVWTGGETPAEPPSQTVDAPALEQPSSTPAEASEGERRQLTVMFCDLVGSTALSEQLDPEDLQTVVRTYQEISAQVIERYEGYIAQYLGDGLLVYFGYPAAHEDDAARAIRAGLEIVTALDQAHSQFPQPVQVRVGIHTGPVVVGQMGGGSRHEQLVLGETPNIAARVQGKAAPDEVVISAATQRMVTGLFETADRGLHDLKGISTPHSLYRVTAESAAQSRFDVAVGAGLTPLVGREEELALLRRQWERAQDGEGQVVLLSGEPGIGKSRLVQELKEQLASEGAARIEFHCSPYHQNSTLYPVIEHLQRMLQFDATDAPATKLEKLSQTLAGYHFPQQDTVPLMAALLSLPSPEGYAPLTLSPPRQKQKTQAALVSWLLEETERHAVYSPWEDLHWADPSTLEVLTLMIQQAPTARLYLLLTFRPEFTSPWGTHSHLSQLTLSRLGRGQGAEMVARVTNAKALPAEVLEQIVAKTDGVPLFVEELTKTVLESGLVQEVNGHYELTGPLPPLAIPSTLQDSLMARLDRLATVREIAQLGAILGREFSYTLIQAVSPLDEEALQQGLKQLVEAELVYQRGLLPQAIYLFKHALIQDTAYQSLLKSTRQHLHQQVAQVLEEQFAETTKTQPELVAHHYTEAGLGAQAIPYWQRAGERALQRSASAEAINHLTTGLELAETLPDTMERAQQELALLIAVGAPLQATKGWAAAEIQNVYTRARELCRQIGESPQVFPMMWGLWVSHYIRAELQTAKELGEQLIRLAQSAEDPVLLLEAHHAQWSVLLNLGELTQAREHYEQGFALYDPEQHRALAFLYGGHDAGCCALSFGSTVLWLLGYPDQARKRSEEAVTLAREISHPTSLAVTLFFAARLHQLCREDQLAQELAQAGIALSDEQGFGLTLAWARVIQGWTLAEQGQLADGIAQIRQGDAAYRATGAEMGRSHHLALLAQEDGKAQQPEEGLAVVAEALDFVGQTGETFYEAELHRLKGELTLQATTGSPDSRTQAALDCFQQARNVARSQQAKSLELRAATSLAHLWQRQGKKEDAHQLLSEIYNWFTEGFDTADLKDAKALLAELS